MSSYYGTFSGRSNHRLRLDVSQGTQNIAGNYTPISWALYIERTSGTGSWYLTAGGSWSVNIGGQVTNGGAFTYDTRSTTLILLGSGTNNVGHNADGTLTLSVSASISAPGSIGSASTSGAEGVPTIPRASTPTFEISGSPVTSVDAGATVTINTNRASGSFTHTILWTFGSQSGTVGTGIGASTTWTPSTSMLTQIPSSLSGSAQITTNTYSGATLIGTKVVNFTITVPSSAVPSLTTVTHSEATTSPNVATIVGAYVMGFTKLSVAITGAAGIYGSSITAYKIEVAGQTINAVSGTTGALGQNGSLTLKGTVTDSRGRTAVKNVTITVLNYLVPAITASSAVRSTVGGTVDPNGTYIKVDITAVVQSLVVGTQKNNLTYTIRIKDNDDLTPWASVTPSKTASAGATGYDDDNIFGTYSISNSFTVRIEITDNLGSLAANQLVVSTGGTLIHLSSTADGMGVGKYWEQGSIDALSQMYQNNGRLVLDVNNVDTNLPNRLRYGVYITGQDLNNITQTGWYIGSTLTNAPGTGWCFVMVQMLDASNILQTVYYRNGAVGDVYQRQKYSNVWQSWGQLHQTAAEVDARIAANPATVARLVKTSAQNTSSSAGAPAAVIWTSDSGGSGLWSSGSPTRVRLTKLGWWRVKAHLRFGRTDGTGYGSINKNGVAGNDASQSLIPPYPGIGSYALPSDLIECTNAATDYVETFCYSTAVTNPLTVANCSMQVEYIGT